MVGTLEPSKYADIVIVDGDPTTDVTVLQDPAAITAVFKSGYQVAAARKCLYRSGPRPETVG